MVGFRESMSTNIGDIYIEPNRKSFKNDLKSLKKNSSLRPVNYFATNVNSHQCVVCKDRHPLYSCHKFKAFTHDQKLSTVREHHLCMNCLSGDHFFKGCASYHRCKQCQKRHHTLLHTDLLWNQPSSHNQETTTSSVTSNAATGLKMETLMMTCWVLVLVLVRGPGDGYMEARALLDSASSASFISERLAQSLHLPRSSHSARISGLSQKSPIQSVASFSISSIRSASQKIKVTAMDCRAQGNLRVALSSTCELESSTSHVVSHHIFLKTGDDSRPVHRDCKRGVQKGERDARVAHQKFCI